MELACGEWTNSNNECRQRLSGHMLAKVWKVTDRGIIELGTDILLLPADPRPGLRWTVLAKDKCSIEGVISVASEDTISLQLVGVCPEDNRVLENVTWRAGQGRVKRTLEGGVEITVQRVSSLP